MSYTPISVVIITFNEEKNIGKCIDAVKDIADNIVILDSNSSDNTEEICRHKGVDFHKQPFLGHIEQKNKAITFAKYPNILSLDADESVDKELKEQIQLIKNNWTHDGYYFNRLNNYCGQWIKHGSWYPDKKLRLWDSRKGKWTGENPHDRYELTQDATSKYLKGNLLHYSFYTVDEHLKQMEKFASIAAKSMHKKGIRFSYLKMIINPIFKFVKNYIFQLGFLDGYNGFIIAKTEFTGTYRKYSLLNITS
jgi:glycosyltransferase involved in cell wall biosynthesis